MGSSLIPVPRDLCRMIMYCILCVFLFSITAMNCSSGDDLMCDCCCCNCTSAESCCDNSIGDCCCCNCTSAESCFAINCTDGLIGCCNCTSAVSCFAIDGLIGCCNCTSAVSCFAIDGLIGCCCCNCTFADNCCANSTADDCCCCIANCTTTPSAATSAATSAASSAAPSDAAPSAAPTPSAAPSPTPNARNEILSILSDPPVFIGIAGGGLVLLVILLCACIGCCVLCSIKRGSKSEKKSGGDPSVRWSKGGKVELLSIAEKAGVEADGQPEAEQSKGASAETEDVAKEDDKRVVTVSTFGFPEVCIQPPQTFPEEEEKTEGKAVEDKKGAPVEEDKGSLNSTQATEPSSLPEAVPSAARNTGAGANPIQAAEVDSVKSESVKRGSVEVERSTMDCIESTKTALDTEGTVSGATQQHLQPVGSLRVPEDPLQVGSLRALEDPLQVALEDLLQVGSQQAPEDLDLSFQLDMDILSNEAIEKALGL